MILLVKIILLHDVFNCFFFAGRNPYCIDKNYGKYILKVSSLNNDSEIKWTTASNVKCECMTVESLFFVVYWTCFPSSP